MSAGRGMVAIVNLRAGQEPHAGANVHLVLKLPEQPEALFQKGAGCACASPVRIPYSCIQGGASGDGGLERPERPEALCQKGAGCACVAQVCIPYSCRQEREGETVHVIS